MKTEVNNYDDQEVRNLPVLYTIPRWQLIRNLNGGMRVEYYIPEIGKWVSAFHMKKYLSIIGLTTQNWYDRWILNITVNSDRPRCCNPSCHNHGMFINVYRGYKAFCSSSSVECKHVARSLATLSFTTTQEYRDKMSNSLKSHPNREWLNLRISEGHQDKKLNDPEGYKLMCERMSAASSRSWENEDIVSRRLESTKKTIESRTEERKAELHIIYSEACKKRYLKDNHNLVTGTRNGKRGRRSKVISEYTGELLRFDSGYERQYYEYSLTDDTIEFLDRSSVRIPYYYMMGPDDTLNGLHTYLPDFDVVKSDGSRLLVEVKDEHHFHSEELVKVKINAAIEYCKKSHLIYCTITEKFLNSHNEEDIYYHVREGDWE